MEQLVHQLTLELQDPIRPKFCLCCVQQCFSDAFDGDANCRTNARILRQDHQDFIACALRYMTTPRTPEDLAIQQSSLRQSILRCRRRAVHGDSSHLLRDRDLILDKSFIVITWPVVACLDAAERTLATQRFSRHGMWPRTVDDILPRGPRDTVTTLLFWCTRMQHLPLSKSHHYMMQTLQNLLRACRPELMPVLTGNDDVRRAFVEFVCRQLDLAVAAHRTSSERRMGVSQANAFSPLDCMEAIAWLLLYITIGAGAHFKDWPRIIHGLEHNVLQSLDPARACMSECTALKHVANELASMQIGIYTNLGEALPEDLKPVLAARTAVMQDPHARLDTALTSIRQHVTCCAHGCGRHPRELSTGKLRRCAACKLFQYCSRECQKLHWTAQPLPHRTVCALLCSFLRVVPDALPKDQLITACRAGGVSDELVATLAEHLRRDELARQAPHVSVDAMAQFAQSMTT